MNAAYKIDPDSLFDRDSSLDQLIGAGFDKRQARLVLAEAENLDMHPDSAEKFQRHFRNENGSVNPDKVAAFMHINATMMTVDSYTPVLEDRAANDAEYGEDDSKNLSDLKIAIQMMHAAEYSAQDIAHVVNDLVKISKASTSHPTEGLSNEGGKLARKLVKAAEVVGNNFRAMKDAVVNIAKSEDFEATKRSNILDEIDDSSEDARIHNKGVNELDRRIEEMIYEVTGEQIEISSNTALRSWDYDADGKNNAEGFSMIAKMSTTKMDALTDLLNNLKKAKTDKVPEHIAQRIQEVQDKVEIVIERLSPIYEESRDIVLALAKADPKERETLYRHHYDKSFDKLFWEFSQTYADVDQDTTTRGSSFYYELVGDGKDQEGILDDLRRDLAEYDEQSAFLLDESYRTVNRAGFALDRGQTRHNDGVYVEMLDNLFESDAFWGLNRQFNILGESDREAIRAVGKFSDLSFGEQSEYCDAILNYVQSNKSVGDQLIDLVGDINALAFKPLSDKGNGYPEQEHTYMDRMKLRSLFPLIFAEGVISDAQAEAPLRQKFFADLLGMTHMRHMPLHEHSETLDKQGFIAAEFNKHGGAENIKSREEELHPYFQRLYETLHVMRATSDSERTGGSFTRLQALQQFREAIREGYKIGVPIEFMLGSGGSLNRFGGDVGLVRRVIAQELKEIISDKIKRGGEMDGHDEKMLIMATSILYTEQGRTKRYASATKNQVRDNFAGKMVEIMQDIMDIRGDVPDHTFIDKRYRFSDTMKKVQHNLIVRAIGEYDAFTHAVKKDANGKPTKDYVMDHYYDNVDCPHLLGFQNNGARPAAGKAKGGIISKLRAMVSELRAIGKDQASYTAQSFHCGIYGSGFMMNRLHDRLHANLGTSESASKNKITLSDIDDLMNQPDWEETIFSRNLLDCGRFNASHLFGRVSKKGWNFDRAVEVGSKVQTKRVMDGGESKRWTLEAEGLDDDYTEEELYLAKIYYERVVFLSMTEAALTPDGEGVTMLDKKEGIINSFRGNNSLDFGLGERTKKKWPSVVEAVKNHNKNAAAYAVYNLVNDDIEEKMQAGTSKDDAIAPYGGGDSSKAEGFFRKISSALRAGTMPHKHKWTGKDTYGVENRHKHTMAEFMNMIFPNFTQEKTYHPAPE